MTNLDKFKGGTELTRLLGNPPNFADADIYSFELKFDGTKSSARLVIMVPFHSPGKIERVTFNFSEILSLTISELVSKGIVDDVEISTENEAVVVTVYPVIGFSGSIEARSVSFEIMEIDLDDH